VSLNASTGAITGTPTVLKSAGNVTVRATGPGGTDDEVINITVDWMLNGQGTTIVGYDTASGFSGTWQDAARSVAAGDGDACYTFDDLSGNGDHLVQATAGARPTVDANGINSLQSLNFDGGDYMQIAAFTGGAVSQPVTIVVIGQVGATGGAHYWQDGGSSAAQVVLYQNGTTWQYYAGSGVDTTVTQNTNLHLHLVVFNGASSTYYLDGTSVKTGNAGANTINGFTMCAKQDGTLIISNGTRIAAMAVFSGDVGATARGNIKTWSVAKWGTPS